MAMLPAKSHQPLHTFSLSFLKRGQRSHVNTSNRCRRLSPHTDSRGSSDYNHDKPPCSRNHMKKDDERYVHENDSVLLERETNSGKLFDADGEVKPWNLRPRRSAIPAIPNHTDTCSDVVPATNNTKSRRLLRGAAAEESEEEVKKKRKLWISLSKEEIEEDLFALSGSKPGRRPKKRNKTVQKQVDIRPQKQSRSISLSSRLIFIFI